MSTLNVEELYRRYGSLVLRRARVILGNEEEARDAMQEVFVKALRSGHGFRAEASPVTWLYQVTTHHCLTRIRDGGRRRVLTALHLVPSPVEVASSTELDTPVLLRQLLARVPEELREIAVYAHVDRMSHEEIAALLKVSRRTVGNRLEAFRRLALAAGGSEEAA